MDERYAHMWQFLLSRPTRRRIITYECTSHISKIKNPEIICKEVTRPVWGHTCVRGISILLCDQNFNVVNNPRFSLDKTRAEYSTHENTLNLSSHVIIRVSHSTWRLVYFFVLRNPDMAIMPILIYARYFTLNLKKIKSSSMWKCDV